MTNPEEAPTVLPNGDETHPAFGVAVVARASGTPRSLFQSDLQHNETVILQLHTATRKRDLNHDWVHADREIIEVEMSLAQWGALVSSQGIGSGTPVTIRRRQGEGLIPRIPYQPRIAENLREVRETTSKLLDGIKGAVAKLHDAVYTKGGVRATKEALGHLESQVGNAAANSAFAVTSLNSASEKVVSNALADIEAHLLRAQQLTGQTSIEAPTILELEAGE